MSDPVVAILYQATLPPMIDGLRKDAKPGGYSDGGADIAVALRSRGVAVVTPVASPDAARALDWVFPDTAEGIAAAIAAGADTLWANTVLFEGHPLGAVPPGIAIVGQDVAAMQRFDDKFATNRMLADAGLPVAESFLLTASEVADARPVAFPLIVKPVRGRGSQGVTLVHDLPALHAAATALIAGGRFGDTVVVERFLPGEEMTVTLLPAACPRPDDGRGDTPFALRPVRRFDQRGGVAPYNGDVPVTANSAAIDRARLDEPAVVAMIRACVAAAALVDARTAIRIDCRADADGRFLLFDLNMKPNMTGPGRPGRDDQDCLSAIAARADGWDYADLLLAMLAGRWVAA